MTDTQYAWLQSVLGTRAPDRATADADFARLGSLRAVALEYLRVWRSEMLSSVSSVTIQGAVSVSYSGLLASLERLIEEISDGPDDPSAPPEGEGGLPTIGFGNFESDFQRPVPATYHWPLR